MSSNEEKKEQAGSSTFREAFDKYKLHFTVCKHGSNNWRFLASQLHCLQEQADIVVYVYRPWQIPKEFGHYAVEEVSLSYGNGSYQKRRWRIFRYERVATEYIVPFISDINPGQPYAEIIWLSRTAQKIRIEGLESFSNRGCGIANEAKLLGDAVDIILGLPNDARSSWWAGIKARQAEAKNGLQDNQLLALSEGKAEKDEKPEEFVSSDERSWRLTACPAAKGLGRRNVEKLTQEVLAEELGCSSGKVKNKKKEFPKSWSLIEDAFIEGKREYAEEQMSRTAK